MSWNRIALPLGVALLALAIAAMGEDARNPCNPCGEKSVGNPCNPCSKAAPSTAEVALNPCHAKRGTVFFVSDPMSRNTVTFSSRAPLEDIIGTTNSIAGYLVFDPKNPDKGMVGSFSVPVASLDTGIPLRDEHLRSAQWLNEKAHPDITFAIERTDKIRLVKKGPGFATYDVTVSGSFTVNGVTRKIDIEARLVYLEESDRTRQKMPGNLLATRATFKVPLADHQVPGMKGVIGSKVQETIQVEVSLFSTDATMSKAANPCNPCGGKAMNPCNPCGGKAANPCNPCGGKAMNPCNPCGGK